MKTVESSGPLHRIGGRALRLLTRSLASCCIVVTAWGKEPLHPLKPPDRSSPRAALKTFLESGDTVGQYIAQTYLPSPSRAKFQRMRALYEPAVQCLDLSAVSPTARVKTGPAAAAALYETLSRIQLPPFKEIPDEDALNALAITNAVRWVIPNTEIAFERALSGPRSGQFLLSSDTVARADDFYERVRGLAYTRPVALENMREIRVSGGGWLVPYDWIQALPAWLRAPIAGQSGWKWIALALTLGIFAMILWFALRLSRLGSNQRPLLQALTQLALPALLLLGTPVMDYLALYQISFIGSAGNAINIALTAIWFLAGAWILWRAAPVVAEAIIASPRLASGHADAHLIRISTRLLGIVAGVGVLLVGSERLGLPLYGIVAGLGVGGLAIALAARPTIENLIGSLSLFADKPVRVGDFCSYGNDVGTVESIGIRSTRIRGLDRSLTTIPNGILSNMPVVNFARRDRMLLRSVMGLRYETSPEQLRYVLAKLRELLLAHPMVTPEPSRVRFVGFGDCSLNVEVFAYIGTEEWNEFLGIQEDLYLRIMDVVATSGTAFAFPSQTLYFARDDGLDPDKSAAAMEEVQKWRAARKLPFPNFDLEFRQAHRDTLDYPPAGSPAAKPT